MSTQPADPVPRKSSGPRRLVNSLGYSIKGLRYAVRREPAFQQQLMLFAAAYPAALWLTEDLVHFFVLMAPLILAIVVELLNTAIECLADQIDREKQVLLGAAKDLGSAAVFICLLSAAVFWTYILVERFA